MGVHYNKADFVNYGKPSLFLDFANKKNLIDRISGNNLITFTRTSSATRVNEQGLIEVVSANTPRFDHNPETGESLGLLVEEQRTNLLLRSGEFNLSWFTVNATIVTNDATAPNGSVEAEKLIETATTGNHEVIQNFTPSANTTYTLSCFIKSAELNVAVIRFNLGLNGSNQIATFTLTGSGSSTITAGSGTASIAAAGNGWYRCSLTATSGSSPSSPTQAVVGSRLGVLGDGTSGIFIWGAQLEVGAFPTSYIPTTSATVTRTQDDARIMGTNFSSWFNSTEGTLYSELFFKGGIFGSEFPNIVKSNGTKFIGPYYTNDDDVYFDYFNETENSVNIGTATLSTNTFHKNATAYKNGDFGASANGVLVGTSSSSITFATDFDQLLLGRWTDGNWYLNGCIKYCSYYPTRLTNDQLQGITR